MHPLDNGPKINPRFSRQNSGFSPFLSLICNDTVPKLTSFFICDALFQFQILRKMLEKLSISKKCFENFQIPKKCFENFQIPEIVLNWRRIQKLNNNLEIFQVNATEKLSKQQKNTSLCVQCVGGLAVPHL